MGLMEEGHPYFSEVCECGHRAIDHSLCFWLWMPGMDYSPIGPCYCECSKWQGPEDGVLVSMLDANKTYVIVQGNVI